MPFNMRFRLAEPSVTALAERMKQNIDEAVQLVNTDVIDGYTIDVPQILDYPLPLELQTAWPLVCIARESGAFTDDSGYAATGAWDLSAWVFIMDRDPQGLARRLERTMAAVLTAGLGAERSFTTPAGAAYGVSPKNIVYGPMLEGLPQDGGEPPHGLLSWIAATIGCTSDEQ